MGSDGLTSLFGLFGLFGTPIFGTDVIAVFNVRDLALFGAEVFHHDQSVEPFPGREIPLQLLGAKDDSSVALLGLPFLVIYWRLTIRLEHRPDGFRRLP
ncbi:hypothetical protein Sbal625DRAFT_2046 [Shewanella baltica OS625]|nr:hypothetical protein Sbal625DRAFT_2046 [Shewanella baltica OS625]SUI48199.1 Uncharacterised protein [Shewanella baltica]